VPDTIAKRQRGKAANQDAELGVLDLPGRPHHQPVTMVHVTDAFSVSGAIAMRAEG
jgi:hypothetical protein